MLACQAKKGATELVGVISSNFQIRAESLPKKKKKAVVGRTLTGTLRHAGLLLMF